jgi:ketosteroid isomerase-like protein
VFVVKETGVIQNEKNSKLFCVENAYNQMSLDYKDILLKANAAIAQGDQEGFLSFCTEDTTWEFVGDKSLTGKDAVREFMKTTYAEPPKFDVEHLIAEGDFVTATGKIGMNDGNGKMTSYAYCDVWRFRDGKLAELKAFVIEIQQG